MLSDTYVDVHLIMEVLVPRDEGVSTIILEADTIGTTIETIEVLDSTNDRLCGIVWEDLNSHWQTRLELRHVLDHELKCDALWGSRALCRRHWVVVMVMDVVWHAGSILCIGPRNRRSGQPVSSSLCIEAHCAGSMVVVV